MLKKYHRLNTRILNTIYCINHNLIQYYGFYEVITEFNIFKQCKITPLEYTLHQLERFINMNDSIDTSSVSAPTLLYILQNQRGKYNFQKIWLPILRIYKLIKMFEKRWKIHRFKKTLLMNSSGMIVRKRQPWIHWFPSITKRKLSMAQSLHWYNRPEDIQRRDHFTHCINEMHKQLFIVNIWQFPLIIIKYRLFKYMYN